MDLPVEFYNYVLEAFDRETADCLCNELFEEKRTVSVRINPLKYKVSEGIALFENVVPWCENGFYLKERPIFTLDPLFHAGAYYVQDSSSMFIELALKASGYINPLSLENLKVLDLCAAPGGKSTDILSMLPDTSLLVSNEVINSRATILAENITKWGRNNVVVTNSDPADFKRLLEWFDIVIVDAPCSGEGMFRKDNNAISEWSVAGVRHCSERQKRILSDIWSCVKPGGVLFYSTCTFNKYENDSNVEFMVKNFGAEVVSLHNIVQDYPELYLTQYGGIQFIPGRVDGEGQFFAVLRKPISNDIIIPNNKSVRGRDNKSIKNVNIKLPEFLKNMTDGYRIVLKNDMIKFIPAIHSNNIDFLEKNLKVILSGRIVANTLGVPNADLAFDANIDSINMPVVELSNEDALKFLAREPLVFSDYPKGYLLLKYCGLGLGFVKNLGNRSNSLLPMNRRIRMSISL